MVVVCGLVVLIGMCLLAVGLRGRRVNDHPVCRRCKFDLVGLYPDAGRCPECGAPLSGRAVRRGVRMYRPLLAGTGGALCLLGVAIGGAGLVVTAEGEPPAGERLWAPGAGVWPASF